MYNRYCLTESLLYEFSNKGLLSSLLDVLKHLSQKGRCLFFALPSLFTNDNKNELQNGKIKEHVIQCRFSLSLSLSLT